VRPLISNVKRIKLFFAPGLEIEFVDRVRGIQQVFEWGEKGTGFPIVVFGPEGCGKTSWLLQTVEILKELGFSVIYFNPMRKQFDAEIGVNDLKKKALEIVKQASSEYTLARLIWSIIDFAKEALKHGRKRLAIIVDDAFQYLECRGAAGFVKGMLELIEHPVESYERIVAIAATSEGLSRYEISRHLWAELMPMWNMSREGFEELYEGVPSPKPSFEDVWRFTGGNPRMLSMFYQARWNVDKVINRIIDRKKLKSFIASLSSDESRWLFEAVEDPDTLLTRERIPLMNKLVELNLIVDTLPSRKEYLWIDQPPPEKDLELGIGMDIAWQTPLYREAVKRTLKSGK